MANPSTKKRNPDGPNRPANNRDMSKRPSAKRRATREGTTQHSSGQPRAELGDSPTAPLAARGTKSDASGKRRSKKATSAPRQTSGDVSARQGRRGDNKRDEPGDEARRNASAKGDTPEAFGTRSKARSKAKTSKGGRSTVKRQGRAGASGKTASGRRPTKKS